MNFRALIGQFAIQDLFQAGVDALLGRTDIGDSVLKRAGKEQVAHVAGGKGEDDVARLKHFLQLPVLLILSVSLPIRCVSCRSIGPTLLRLR